MASPEYECRILKISYKEIPAISDGESSFANGNSTIPLEVETADDDLPPPEKKKAPEIQAESLQNQNPNLTPGMNPAPASVTDKVPPGAASSKTSPPLPGPAPAASKSPKKIEGRDIPKLARTSGSKEPFEYLAWATALKKKGPKRILGSGDSGFSVPQRNRAPRTTLKFDDNPVCTVNYGYDADHFKRASPTAPLLITKVPAALGYTSATPPPARPTMTTSSSSGSSASATSDSAVGVKETADAATQTEKKPIVEVTIAHDGTYKWTLLTKPTEIKQAKTVITYKFD